MTDTTDTNDAENLEGVAGRLDALVMPDLSSPEWDHFTVTPAGGIAYHNQGLDMTAVAYTTKTKLYFGRVENSAGKYPACFSCCKEFEA